ncbi:MAG: RDD family protein [Holophagaceae bacterium]|nr:RDD family protein [Holophagaceae bacterium]
MLEAYLPPIPDDAVPTGQRGELVDRLVATLIDIVPAIIIAVAFWVIQMVLAFIPFLGCIAGCALSLIHLVVQVAYTFYFIPYCVSKNGASIGKKMQKLRVVPLGNPSGRLELLPAILRQFGNFFALNLIVLAIKGDERISLSDMIAKSEVIKVDR